jgi:chemotaxis signal transduction protein
VIDAVRQILWLDAVQIQPLFSSGLKPEDGFSGLVYDQSGLPMLVLDCDHLLARSARFPAAQGKTAQGNDPLQNGHAESESAEAYVAFHAGGHRAMRLSTIQSIINYPRNIYLAAQRHPAFVGSFHWREKGVALWDLSALLGGKPTTVDDETRVLIVAKDEHLVGLICERLLMLLPSRQIEVLKMRSETGRVIEVISHHEGGGVRKSYGKFEPTLCEELL